MRRVRQALPVVPVASAAELRSVLGDYRALFREQAVIQLGDRPEVDREIDAFLQRMGALAEPRQHDHSLPWLMHRFRQQLYRARARIAAEELPRQPQVPTDSVLKTLDPEVVATLDAFPPAEREAMRLHAVAGMTPRQIATHLGVAPQTARMRLLRGRDRLRAWFPDRFPQKRGVFAFGAGLARRLLRRARRPLAPEAASALPAFDSLGQLAASFGVMLALAAPAASTESISPVAIAKVSASMSPTRTAPAAKEHQGHVAPAVALATGAPGPGRDGPDGGAGAALLPDRTAATETPEDTHIQSFAATDDLSEPAVVALGQGRACACSVLLLSADGGRSWRAAPLPAPSDAVQVVLPPRFPADPRIFLGSSAVGGLTTYVVPWFGAPAEPLGTPPGGIALAAGFDNGDDRLYVAAASGVLSVQPGGGAAPQLVLAYPAIGNPASINPAMRQSGAALVVLAPPFSVDVADGTVPPGAATPTVMACGGTVSRCAVQSVGSSSARAIAAAADSRVTAVWSAAGIADSVDGGRDFEAVPLPPGTSPIAVTVSGDRLWLTYLRAGSTGKGVAWQAAEDDVWHDVSSRDAALTQTQSTMQTASGRVLALLADGGLRCSADDGDTWHTRCP